MRCRYMFHFLYHLCRNIFCSRIVHVTKNILKFYCHFCLNHQGIRACLHTFSNFIRKLSFALVLHTEEGMCLPGRKPGEPKIIRENNFCIFSPRRHKQSHTADKGWFSRLVLGWGLQLTIKKYSVSKCHKRPRTRMNSLDKEMS
jgi:hypothetical protein